MALTAEQFGKALVASGLTTAEELKASWNSLPADGRPKDAAGFARALIDLGRLTPFQAQELLAGRGERLQMGEYLLLAEIGAGGMGKVYKAQHRRMKRIVALKVMSSAAMQDDAAVKRFQREVEAAARLEHPNIVTAYDSGEVGKVKYLVMQFVDGGDLSDFVKKNGPLPIEAAVDYVLQAARGLAFAHAAGVVHRDIKPANLLLDKKGVVKILDMGLARIEDGDGLTATEQVMGTVDYMSPEQAAETKNADARSDIYSLGCTLWYLLSAKKLFDGDTMISRLMKHRDAEPPSLVKTRDDASWPLEQAFHKMIAKRPQDRYQSMDEVIAALEPFGPSGSPSSGGMGSSIGGGKGQSAELASFMQAMAGGKSTGSSASLQTKSATSPAVDATAAFSSAEIGTDPKSALHSRGASPLAGAKPQSGARKKKPPVKLIAGGLGAFALLACFGIWVVVRDKEGRVVAEVAVPDGGEVSVRQTTLIDVAPAVAMTNATPGATAPAVSSPTSSIRTSAAAIGTAAPAAERWPYDPPDGKDYVWSTPENLGTGVNGPAHEHLAGVSDDELAIYFLQRISNLMVARRARVDLPFSPAQPVPGVTATGGDAAVSADERTLAVMQSPDGRKREIWWSERRSSADVFPELRALMSADRRSEGHAVFSPDGLTMLTTTGDVNMWTRSALGAPFTGPQRLPEPVSTSEWDMPAFITSDQRLIIVMHQTGSGPRATRRVVYHTRADRNLPFDAARPLDVPLGPAADLDTNGGFRLSGDGRSVYFSSFHYPGGAGNEDIWVSRRVPKVPSSPTTATPTTATPPANLAIADILDSPGYMWSAPENLGPTINGPGPEDRPSLTNDQLRIRFNKYGDNEPREAVRTSTTVPFGTPQKTVSAKFPWLSGDGLTLACTVKAPDGATDDLALMRRATTESKWEERTAPGPEVNQAGNESRPTLSPDGATLVFSWDRDLWLSRRASPEKPFGPATKVGPHVNNSEKSENVGQLLADNETFVFSRDNEWYFTYTSPTGIKTALSLRNAPFAGTDVWFAGDGTAVYFAADLPGGFGDKDIWVTRRVPKGSTLPTPLTPPLAKAPFDAAQAKVQQQARAKHLGTEPKPENPAAPRDVSLPATSLAELLTSDDYDWTPPANLGPSVNSPGDDADPSLTSDQLRLFYRRKSHPEGDHSEAVRTKVSEPFAPPKSESTAGAKPYLSGDGLALVVTAGDEKAGDVVMFQRPARDGKWGFAISLGPTINGLADDRSPTLSPDGLALVFRTDRTPEMKTDLWICRRKSTRDAFGPAETLGPLINTKEDESFGLMLADGRTLLFRRGRGWQVAATSATGELTVRPLAVGSCTALQSATDLWLAPDGQTAYFSAVLPGGLGGYDLWMTERVPKEDSARAPRPTTDATVAGASLDRQVAERLLELKFPVRLTVASKVVPIKPGSPLPAEPFAVVGIDAGASQAAPPAELATLLSDFGRLTSVGNTFMPQEDCDRWAATFAAMPSIMAVNASRCEELTDVGAAHLARLPKLEYLNIGSSTRITSVGLAAFEKCKTLTTIELNQQAVADGKYTLADIQKLQDALPKTRIVFGGVKPIPGLRPAAAK